MVGKTVSHYRIIEKLGGGGIGVVCKAECHGLRRTVALKSLPEELSRDRQSPDTCEREAQAASASNHPHICAICAIDGHEGRPVISMESFARRDAQAPHSCKSARHTVAASPGKDSFSSDNAVIIAFTERT